MLKQIRARTSSALEAVGRGESLPDPAVTEKVLERVRRIATDVHRRAGPVTQQEKILLPVAEGKEIASDVFPDKTVMNYASSILSKLNSSGGPKAAAFVAKHRIARDM